MEAFRALLTSTVPFLPITITWLEALFVVEALRYLVLPAVRNYLLPLLQGGRGWRHYVRSGEWAVVTGGSDGIGKAYAAELLARGMNVLIIARSKDKLEGVCAELRGAAPGQRVEYHVADFSAPGIYADISAKLKALKGPIGLLVNNVGMSYPNPLFFHELAPPLVDAGFLGTMVNINLLSVVEMTALVLPHMLAAKRGAIVNISSAAGNVPAGSPLLALYSATKAGVDVLSRSLHSELARTGVHVECQVPYFVTTKLSKIRDVSLFNVSPETFVASSLAALGRRGPSFVPHWSHALQDAAMQALPLATQASLQTYMHMGLRARAAKKREGGSSSSGSSSSAGRKSDKSH